MFCPSCNTSNRDDAKFCKGCGRSMASSAGDISAINLAPAIPDAPTEHVAEPVVDDINSTSTGETQAAIARASALHAQQQVEDSMLESTVIMSPERMMAYHQRHWRDAMEPRVALEPDGSSVSVFEAPEEPDVDKPGQVEPALESLPAQDEHDAIPIPPPPPPESLIVEAEGAEDAQGYAMHDAGYLENAGYPEIETSETMPDSSQHESLEQAEQAQPVDGVKQAGVGTTGTEASAFAVMVVGATLQGRYEISQVVADNVQEHVYQVIDHQGYQRCWNCNSENNTENDDFCTDCGASLRDMHYIMHEYSSEQSKEDTPVLHGNIVNTFVDQGCTYVIEQPQVEQNSFPNGVFLLAATSSDGGNVRRSDPNEDSSLVLQLQRIHESLSSPVGVYIVADGMGGHDNGQLASRMTINAIAERMVRDLLLTQLTSEKEGIAAKVLDEEGLVTLLHDAIEDANTALCEVNARNKTDMGSTLTGFMVVGQQAFIVNVGDSRTYMVRDGQIYQLTTDHSLVGQLVASGLIEPDDVYTHPQRSQIYRSLGDKPNTQIDIFKQQLHPGDKLLSCCDGLWEMVRNPQIESTLNTAPDPQTACQQLIDLANTNGGEDNITAVIVYVQ
jgi:serine/threonine protein phosphatase PrpC